MTLSLVLLTTILVLISVPAFFILVVYSINLYFLVILALIQKWRIRWTKTSTTPSETEIPFVTVQIPLYNERYVSRRVIDAVAKFDWPADKLQIQVLDDSTDETRQIVAEAVAIWKERGVNVEHIMRPNREGYKAGALSYALTWAKGEYIAIFDADFLPAPDFLRQTVPALVSDPKAAFVQVRWEHLNREESWLTRVQAVALDGHFGIEQFSRSGGGYAFNFNGTAGVWRRAAIENSGGWKSNTLTEDLDLSYRVWLNGWHGRYRVDVTAPAELPPTMTAFRRQQSRWAQGCIECSWLLLPSIWRTRYPLMSRIQATIHLLGYLTVVLMVLLMLCYPLLISVLPHVPGLSDMFVLANYLGPMTIAPTVFYLVGQLIVRRFEWRTVASVLVYQIVGAGMAMNTTRAALKALFKQRVEFLRTPKWGSSSPRASAYRLKADLGVVIDFLWAAVAFLVAILAFRYNHLFIAMYGLMSSIGSLTVGLWTIWPEMRPPLDFNRRPLVDTPSGA